MTESGNPFLTFWAAFIAKADTPTNPEYWQRYMVMFGSTYCTNISVEEQA
ncbi:hypothetical protein VD0004_g8172 [Verticillium dahliae]|nr:hypothetical protein VD0004_g8172 [Verticillium dahliae]PNH66648.1 hypothetical protein VD0001_g8097 [Verticillium dahliae]RBQ87105.1 hypothetical protein VDGD_20722 [Verticillium dahliae]